MSTDIVANPEPQDLESTWASRNPTKPVIIPRTHVNKKRTHTEQITAHTKQVLNQEKAEALQQAIQACLTAREAEIKHLAKDYGKKPDYIERLLNHGTNYTSHQRPSFYNALVHHLAQELNEGTCTFTAPLSRALIHVTDWEIGDRLHLQEIKDHASEEMRTHHFSKEEKETLIQELTDFREVQQKGARWSNRAAAADMHITITSIAEEVSSNNGFLEDLSLTIWY